MFKKLSLTLLLLGFFVGIFTLALAQEATPLVPNPSPTPVEYILPYPGILPDHPLYFLKTIRDKILTWFITNPVRKVEFQILLADKHLNMGVFLMDKGKADLAAKVVSDCPAYLKKAYAELLKVPTEDAHQAGNLKDRLEKSILKHQQILNELAEKGDNGNQQQVYTSLLTQLDQLLTDFSRNK